MSCDRHKDWPNVSEFIQALIQQAEKDGFAVVEHGVLPDDVIGRIHYDTKQIEIDTPCAGCALEALAHEVGHLILFRAQKQGAEEFEAHVPLAVREAVATDIGENLLGVWGLSSRPQCVCGRVIRYCEPVMNFGVGDQIHCLRCSQALLGVTSIPVVTIPLVPKTEEEWGVDRRREKFEKAQALVRLIARMGEAVETIHLLDKEVEDDGLFSELLRSVRSGLDWGFS